MNELNMKMEPIEISITEIWEDLKAILSCIDFPAFTSLNEAINISQYGIAKETQDVVDVLIKHKGETVRYEFEVKIDELTNEWNNYYKQYGAEIDDLNKKRYVNLIKNTLEVIQYLRALPEENFIKKDDGTLSPKRATPNVRTMPKENIEKDTDEKNSQIKTLEALMVEAKQRNDSEQVSKYEELLEKERAKLEELKDSKKQIEQESESETLWKQRISESFKALKECTTDLENSKQIYTYEFGGSIGLIAMVVALFAWWYYSFYSGVSSGNISISCWFEYFPYMIPLPVSVALVWVLVVQKNRASRLAEHLNSRISNIRYLEGLMLLVNRLSLDSVIASQHINEIVDKLVDCNLKQLEESTLSDIKIDRIETEETNDIPAKEIIDILLKHIRHDK